MLIKKTAAGFATGAALALFMGDAAQAGFPTVTTTPNPSVAGASVTLSSTAFGASCSGATVEFRDITGLPEKALCNGSVSGAGAVSCSTNLLTDAGARTVRGVVVTGVGVCTAGVISAPATHNVTAAPAGVPTTSEWTLWGLAGLLLLGGGVVASRRFRVAGA